LGWGYEAGIQFVRLILAGVFDKFRDLQIILGHWGEANLFYLERLNSIARVAHLQRRVAGALTAREGSVCLRQLGAPDAF
jgi:predicted TIM-barrel fold metal-dependent hydrolase